MSSLTTADLRPVDLFDRLSDDELAAWTAVTVEHREAPGAALRRIAYSTP